LLFIRHARNDFKEQRLQLRKEVPSRVERIVKGAMNSSRSENVVLLEFGDGVADLEEFKAEELSDVFDARFTVSGDHKEAV
jgi:hypothetical protein